MTLGIYKPSQGYWVRVMTATLIGVVALAASAWTYKQMELVASKLPITVWAMPVGLSAVELSEGQSVTLVGKSSGSDSAPEIGTATVESFNKGGSELRIHNVQMKDAASDPSLAAAVKVGAGAPVKISGQVHGDPSVNPMLIQGIAMAVVLLLGAVLAYWATAINQRFVDFLIATDGEMKKVNWSTKKDIQKSTIVVIFASIMLAGCLFFTDIGFQWFFKTIGVLAH